MPAATRATADEWHERVGRIGFVAKGVLYGIIGVIAIAVALGDEKSAADQTGALSSLSDSAVGKVLLVLLAIGLGAYALFRLVEVFAGVEGEDGASEVAERAASLVSFVVYGALCVSAVRILGGASKNSGNEDSTTSTVFDLPAGVVLVFIAGVVLIGVACQQVYKAFSTSFEEDLEQGRMSARMKSVARPLGITGISARAVVFALIGGFLIKAAVEHSAKETKGLDGALQEIAQQPYGTVLLLVVALGLFVYGAYSLVEARYKKL